MVISGIQDENYQNLILLINEKLSSKSFNPSKTILTRDGKDEDVLKLISDMNQGKVGALIMCGVNPAYTLPNSEEFIKSLKSLEMSICFSMKNDETVKSSQNMLLLQIIMLRILV